MEQEFVVEPFKLIQDKISYGVSRHLESGEWEVVATFKFPGCAVKYFAECVLMIGSTDNKDKESDNG